MLALAMFCNPEHPGKLVLDFVDNQSANSRRATADKAKALRAKFRQSY